MELLIESLETAGPDGRARRLVFADGSPPRTTSAAVAKEIGLAAGLSVDPAALETALAEAEPCHAKERALSLLSYRERSATEVDRRLSNDGYPPDVRRDVIDRLIELGLIDDARFALVYARSRFAAGFGTRRVSAELKERGVEDALAKEAIHEASGDVDELSRARAALRGRVATGRSERERLLRRLVSRGFDLGTAIAALDQPCTVDGDEPFVGE